MKKTLQFMTSLICFISVNSFGQSLVVSLVANTPVGTSASISFSYTSNVSCAVYAELRLANIDGNGVITQDYSSGSNYISGGFSSTLPIAATSNNGTVSVSVPGSSALSSSLPAGKTYSWVYKLTPGVNDYNEVGTTYQYTGATIIASASVVDNLALVTPPTQTNVGSNVSITVNYTCPAPRLVKFGIAIYNASGFVNDLVGVGVDNLTATTTTLVSLTQELTIPANAIPSADLPSGQFYKVDTALFTPNYASYIMGASSNLTIGTSLGTNLFNKNNIKIYPNPVSNLLTISDISDLKTYEIYNYIGQKVVNSTALLTNSIEISNLNPGIYFLLFDGQITTKFIKE